MDACPKLINFRLDNKLYSICYDADKAPFDVVLGGSPNPTAHVSDIWNRQLDRVELYEENQRSTKILAMSFPNFTFSTFTTYVSPYLTALELELDVVFDIWIQDGGDGVTSEMALQHLDTRFTPPVKSLKLYILNSGCLWESEMRRELKRKLESISLYGRIARFETFVDIIYRKCNSNVGLICSMTLNLYDETRMIIFMLSSWKSKMGS